MTQFLRESPGRVQAVKWVNRILTGLVFLSYPLFLFYLLWNRDNFFARACLVPFLSFVFVSVLRNLIHAERPYEKFGVVPVIEKDTEGKSFPSRHVFSVFIIAMTLYCYLPWVGICFMVIGFLLGAIRVLGGVHYPRDVIAGALIGILCGLLCYL